MCPMFATSMLIDEPDASMLFSWKNKKKKGTWEMEVYNLTTYSLLACIKILEYGDDSKLSA